MADEEGRQLQGSRRRGQHQQQQNLTSEFANLNLSSSGRGGRGRGGRGGSASERGSSRSRGGSPANYRGNYGGHQGRFRGPSDNREDHQNHAQSRGNLTLSGGADPTAEVEVNLETNFFEIDTKNVKRFHRYGLTIKVPDGDSISGRAKQRVVYLLVKELKGYNHSDPVARNYHDLPVSVQPVSILQFPHTVHIRYYDEDERQARPDPEPDDSVESALAELNTLFNHRPRQYCVRSLSQDPTIAAVGAFRFFALNEAHDLSDGLEARHSLFKSSRLAEDRILLNVGSSTSAFYQPGCLFDLLEAWGHTHEHDWYPQLENFIKGVRVKTHYLIGHGHKADGSPITEERIYTITGLGRTDAHPFPGNVHFKLDNGDAKDQKSNPSKVSVGNASKGKPHKVAKNALANTTTRPVGLHFKTEYSGLQLDPRDYIIKLGSRPIFIPSKFLGVLPRQPFRHSFIPEQTSRMIEYARQTPAQVKGAIRDDGMRLLGFDPPGCVHGPEITFNISANTKLLEVRGRMLRMPNLVYHLTSPLPRISLSSLQRGKWDLEGRIFAMTPRLQIRCSILELLRLDGRAIGNKDLFKHKFSTALSACGLLNCLPFRLHGDELWDIIKLNPHRKLNKRSKEQQDFEATKGNLQRLKSDNVDLVVVLLSDKDADTYATLKRVGDIVVGIRTLCTISGKHNSGTGDDIYANLAMKFNLKASQETVNHMLDREHKGPILDDTTCILGMDVTHPGAGSLRWGPSIAAVVANTDNDFAQWTTSLRSQLPDDETKKSVERIVDLKDMVVERLKVWRSHHNDYLPKKLIVYRDGVSESQFAVVQDQEVPAIKAAIAELYDDLYGGGDDDVLHNSDKTPIRDIQEMTFNLCYLYGKSVSSVSLVLAAYYADKVYDRARCYYRRAYAPFAPGDFNPADFVLQPHRDVRDRMFFI